MRAWNAAATIFGAGRQSSSQPMESLLEAAMRRTGLEDFGGRTFCEPLRLLVASLERSAGLHPFGRFLARRVLIELLCNRLYAEHEYRSRPAIDDVRIIRPLIILGLPRTGTSFLFRLLACDPSNRFLTNWEASRPAPPPGRWARTRLARRVMSLVGLAAETWLAPRVHALHRSSIEGPEECTVLLMHEFASQAFVALFNVPDYMSWLDSCDYTPSTRYHQRLLKVVDAERPGRRWLLKSPNHLPALGALLSTYPGAHIVQTHRDPASVLASCCSLVAAYRGMFTDRPDGPAIGVQTMHGLLRGLERAATTREGRRKDEFFDVQYTDLRDDPVGVIRLLYRHFDLKLTSETALRIQAALQRELASRPSGRPDALDRFGLDVAAVRESFAWYSALFQIPPEHALA